MAKKSFLYKLEDEELKKNIFADLRALGAKETADRYFEILGKKKVNLYQTLLREYNALGFRPGTEPEVVLSEIDEKLLEDYAEGKIGFDQIQKEMAVRMFKKVLSGKTDIKVADWLRSESVKMRKDATEKQKESMEIFIDTLFSGIIPSPICPHCGEHTSVDLRELNETLAGKLI